MRDIIKNFIVIEGSDGSGTTTQAKIIAEKLGGFFTFEPSDSDIGRLLRRGLSKEMDCTYRTLALLFAADRDVHLNAGNGIIERCKKGKVICDRYIFSSLVYQSLNLPEDEVLSYNEKFPLPEVLIFIDTPVDVCFERVSRRKKREIFEEYDLMKVVSERYKRVVESFDGGGMRIIHVDGTLSIDEITNYILDQLQDIVSV